jgi:hypothetical protein
MGSEWNFAFELEREIERLQKEMQEAIQRGDGSRAATLNLELQKKLQQRNLYIQTISNINNMTYDLNRNIISGLK